MTPSLALPKINPNHRSSPKKENQKAYPVLRPVVRDDTYARDGGRCRCPCHRVLYLRTDNPFMLANIHETEEPRHECAIDVTLKRTIVLAPECHENVTKNKLTIEYGGDDLKCNGVVYFTGKLASGRRIERYASEPMIDFDTFRANRRASNQVLKASGATEQEDVWPRRQQARQQQS